MEKVQRRELFSGKRALTLSVLAMYFLTLRATAQDSLSLQTCYELARTHYPLIKQMELIESSTQYSMENAAKGYLPQLSFGGQATYQSDVTRVPLEIPGVEPLSKHQYRVFGEASQALYNGSLPGKRQRLEEIAGKIEGQELEVELYQVRSRINELFFGILLTEEQSGQTELMEADLNAALKKIESSIEYGTAIPSSAEVLKAELLLIEQKMIELKATGDAFRKMLGLFVNRSVSNTTRLIRPSFERSQQSIDRPELSLFQLHRRRSEISEDLMASARRPRVDFFVQAGYGRPGLNMLDNTFDLYYLGGVRFIWTLSGYYTLSRERQIHEIRRRQVKVREETFLFNTGLSVEQHRSDIAKLEALLNVDDAILALRRRVTETAAIQLQEGVISATDYVRIANEEDKARQSRLLHETKLLMARANLHFTTGNP